MTHYPITYLQLATYINCSVPNIKKLVTEGLPVLGKPHDKSEPLVDVEAVREWLAWNYPQRRQSLDESLPPLPAKVENRLPSSDSGVTIKDLIESDTIPDFIVDPENASDLSGGVALYERLIRAKRAKNQYEREKGNLVERVKVKELLYEIMTSLANNFGDAFCRRLEAEGANYDRVKAVVNASLNSIRDDMVSQAERTFPRGVTSV